MKLHAYKGETVEEVGVESLKHEIRSAAREFFQPITVVAEALVNGGEHILDSVRRQAIRRTRPKKGESAPR